MRRRCVLLVIAGQFGETDRGDHMTSEGKAVLESALALKPVERASVISELLASFDRSSRVIVDAAWAQEAEKRIDAHDRGDLASVPEGYHWKRDNGPRGVGIP